MKLEKNKLFKTAAVILGLSLLFMGCDDGNSSSDSEDNSNDDSTGEVIDGIDTSTGYAENYVATGDEMTLDFDSVTWTEVYCDTASELTSALSSASAGDKIIIAAGTYTDTFKLEAGGSQNSPIWIVGEDSTNMPVLDGDDYNNNTVLAIDGGDVSGISYVYVQDIKVTNGRTGISMDQADYITIDSVEVYDVGQAGIHVRDESEYNIIKDSTVSNTGLYNVKYGEAIYIGSDNTKWTANGGSYDPACDYVQILNNTLGPGVTAEHIDVKEGSSYAYIIGNTFDASGMIDIINGGLSFIDFKGNYAECAYNTGDQNYNEYFENAFEINDKWTGWGNYNDIHNNSITFNEEYYNSSSTDVTLDLALGSDGVESTVTTTDSIDRDQWVVECNDQSSYDGTPTGNVVSSNTRDPEDSDRMYNSSDRLTEY
ncbi:MAG: hypothetical protein PQJ59_11645 [Spirochaetales bacterium]|nr:hypothetical protein [Spirochaetales bacterium]